MTNRQDVPAIFSLDADSANDGQALVEMAFVMPILLLVLTGIFSLGLTLNNYILLTEATGAAARQLAIERGATTDPCAAAASALYAAAPTLAQLNLALSIRMNGNTYTAASCNSSTTSTGAAADMILGQPVAFTVTYPCNLKIFSTDLAPNCALVSQTTEIIQ